MRVDWNHQVHKGHKVVGRAESFEPIPKEVEKAGRALLDAAIEVHRHLGPGFLERIYEESLCHELALRGVSFERQKSIQVFYKDMALGKQRVDLLVEGVVVVEIKAVDAILPIHQAQLLSYLKTADLRLGFIINFKTKLLKQGIKRMVL
jgi:GxxExxY protein